MNGKKAKQMRREAKELADKMPEHDPKKVMRVYKPLFKKGVKIIDE